MEDRYAFSTFPRWGGIIDLQVAEFDDASGSRRLTLLNEEVFVEASGRFGNILELVK